jgi:WD40 repeat protein
MQNNANQFSGILGVDHLIELSGHSEVITQVVWSPDGKLLASASDDCTVRIWDPASRKPKKVLRIDTRAQCLGWSPDSNNLVCGTNDGSLIRQYG